MATDKRERQRANREAKQAAQRKVERRQSLFDRSKRIAIWVVLGIVLLFLANLVFGGSSDEVAGTADLAAAVWGV
jgi:hypothetical protein